MESKGLNRELLPTLNKVIAKEASKKSKIVGERIKLFDNLDTRTLIQVPKLSF